MMGWNRQYTLAAYLTAVSDKTGENTEQSQHYLAVEVNWRNQTRLPGKERLCTHCDQGTVETELHYRAQWYQYESIRDEYFRKAITSIPPFLYLSDSERRSVLLVETEGCCRLVATTFLQQLCVSRDVSHMCKQLIQTYSIFTFVSRQWPLVGIVSMTGSVWRSRKSMKRGDGVGYGLLSFKSLSDFWDWNIISLE